MQVHIRFFAILRDRAGVADLAIELPDESTVEMASSAIAAKVPAIRDFLPRVAYAVNREYVKSTVVLKDGDELALIPPVSGG